MPAAALSAGAELLAAWRRDPALFIHDAWPEIELREWQSDFVETIRDPDARRTALLVPRDGGKSFIVAAVALWQLCTTPGTLVLLVAPIGRQLDVGLMVEVRSLWQRSEVLRGLYPSWKLQADGIQTPDPQWRLLAVATDRPERLEAPHSPAPPLIVVDEARGLDDEFLKSLEGILTNPESRLIAASVAGAPRGFFYDAFHGNHGGWDRVISIPLSRLPHVRAHYQKLLKRYGADDPLIAQQYLNRFADVTTFSLFDAEMISKCVGLNVYGDVKFPQHGPARDRIIGADLAMRVDDTALTFRAGMMVERFALVPPLGDEMMLVEQLATNARRFRADSITVDEIGLGAGIASRLAERLSPSPRIEVLRWNAAVRAADSERYSNRKTEVVMALHRLVTDQAIGFPANDPMTERLSRELCGLQLVEGQGGRVRIEDPRQSPDVADSLIASIAFDETAVEPSVVWTNAIEGL